MKKPDGHPDFPVWKLERYLLGELPAEELARIGKLRKTDPVLAEWLRALEAEHEDLAQMHPTGRVAGRIWNRLRESDPAMRRAWMAPRIWVPAFGLLLIAALLPLTYSSLQRPPSRSDQEEQGTRLKGLQPALYLFRKAGDSALGLRTGERVRPGELIQIYYDAAGRGYGAIFSLDRNGEVTWHLPDEGTHSAPLAQGGKTPLGFAFELDSLPGYERFFFVAADRPFELATALAEIAKSGIQSPLGPARLDLDSGFFQYSILLKKDTGI